MEETMQLKLTNDEMIMQLMELLKQNGMQKEANSTFELCVYVDSLERKLDTMTEELSNMRQQIKEIQEDTIVNHVKNLMQQSVRKLQYRCAIIREQLFAVKDNIRTKARDIVSDVRKKGKAALNRVSEFLGVKEKLVSMREHVKESEKEVSNTIAKIDAFGTGMREAGQQIANTFRTFADKTTVDYSQKEKTVSVTESAKIPWIVNKKMLEAIEIRLDGAIDKVENLSRDVKVDRILDAAEKDMEKSYSEQMTPASFAMVAENHRQYGADVYDAYVASQTAPLVKMDAPVKTGTEKSKAR